MTYYLNNSGQLGVFLRAKPAKNRSLGIAVKVPIYWGVKAAKPLSHPNIWTLSRGIPMTPKNTQNSSLLKWYTMTSFSEKKL